MLAEARVLTVDQRQQFGVQVRPFFFYHVDHDDRHALPEQRRTFGYELGPRLGPILVGRADQLDRGHQPAIAAGVVDANLILICIRQFRRQR